MLAPVQGGLIALALLLVAGPPTNATLTGRLEVAAHDPVVITADVEIPDGWAVLYDWEIDRPGKLREVDSGRSVHVWAPPGTYEIELSAILARQAEAGGGIEFRKETSVTLLVVTDPAKPDPPRPPPDPNPDPTNDRPETVLIIRTVDDTTDERLTLIEIRQLATFDGNPRLLILDAAQRTGADTPDPLVTKYKNRVPQGADYPYFFAVDAKGRIVTHGEVGTDAKAFGQQIDRLLR